MSIVEKFLAKVEEIIPHAANDFTTLLAPAMNWDGVDKDVIDAMCFEESKYLGGQANVILQMI